MAARYYDCYGNFITNSDDPARHHVVDVRFPPSLVSGRLRKRGPRSMHAGTRRKERTLKFIQRQPRGSDLCDSKSVLSCLANLSILNLNVHGSINHRAKLEVHIEKLKCPQFISMTDCFFQSRLRICVQVR